MPAIRLVLVLALGALLAACGSDTPPIDDSTGGTPGTGGDGGSGGSPGTGGDGGDGGHGGEGEGGSGGSVRWECGTGRRVLELEGVSGTTATLEGMLAPSDHWYGSCSPEGSVGHDVIVRFRAVESGYHRFSTAGTDYDTLLFAMTDCLDGFSELACNDDAEGGKHSRVVVNLEAGDEIYVVVDTVDVKQAVPFVLTAEQVDIDPPVIEDFELYTDRGRQLTALRATGRNPDGLLRSFMLQAFSASGSPLTGAGIYPLPVEFMGVRQGDGTFEVEGIFGLDGATIGRIDFYLIDENGQQSELQSVLASDPPLVDLGAPCDRNGLFSACGEGNVCVDREGTGTPVCSVAHAPELDVATAYRNQDEATWGLLIEGVDVDHDIVGARLLPLNDRSQAMAIGLTGPTLVPFHHEIYDEETGAFRGVVSMKALFRSFCSATNATCNAEKLAEVASVKVVLVDFAGLTSAELEVPLVDSPAAELGEDCDPRGVIGICPEAAICYAELEGETEVCHEEAPLCPEGYAEDLLQEANPGREWVALGDNLDAEPHGATSCGAGGPSQVISFTPPATGLYQIFTSDLAPGVDTVVSVRRYCQLPGYELACNDDGPSGAESNLNVSLTEGETVYIVVDSPDGASIGSYRLVVRKR